ncbi:MAG: D-arabinono-1,4-lactone oxidase [Actinomycetota bacterium]
MTERASKTAIWTNWSGRLQTTEGRLVHVRSDADAAGVASRAADEGGTVRVAGAGHSHMPLVPNETIVDVSGLSGLVAVDAEHRTATIRAGTPIYAIGPALHQHGLALSNQGDIDRQFLGGAVATGTHGTGRRLGNFSSRVVGARLVTAAGDVVDCSPTVEPDLWQAARHHLGALGIVTELTLEVRDAYRLREQGTVQPFEELAPGLPELGSNERHAEFFWYPVADQAVVKVIDETTDEPEYPLADEGSRVGWNYEVLPNHRTWPHTEMEYSVPLDDGPACLDAIRELLRRRFPDMRWPVEYRTLAADDVWLSTAHQRPTVTISLHMPVDDDEQPMFAAAEEVFRSFGGRPHWGKVNYLTGPELAEIHPCWESWWTVRDAVDPGGVFLNDYLRSIRP